MNSPTYKKWDCQRSILVGGSNQNGNDKYKQSAIALFQDAGLEVHHTCDIFQSYSDDLDGNRAVLKCLAHSDFYYVCASVDGYTGFATASKFAYAWSLPNTKLISSHPLIDPDLAFYVDFIRGPEEFARLLDKPKKSQKSEKK
ncbi:hypothetical protein Xen7305DRAFT_00009030 [Xenococcus sp. PCC 7305]|uniref:hypothetical protein n=1 Tax=Xenococcus sp. PCC 7305 TaxID=102125 RepID=UPI0002ACC918|nr:hypothetical protein [Xenococcus sp. PCC 7305]ELS01201.1 hypothetical protein Xen7305DRAFT_00009030 [Xenococcus sp. PCC 7305]